MSYFSPHPLFSFVVTNAGDASYMIKIYHILFFSLFGLLPLQVFSQTKPQTHESMIWFETIEKVQLNDRLSATLLWHHRIFFEREHTTQDIYWLSLNGLVAKNLTVSGGMMYFTYRKNMQGTNIAVPEWRPFQSVTYSGSLKKTKINFRLMTEQRYTRQVLEGHLTGDYHFNIRLRNRLQVFVPVHLQWKVEIAEEILLRDINHGRTVFDQSRARVRLHFYPGNGKFGMHLGYLHWLLNTADDLEHRHAVMVGVRHVLDL